MKPCNVPTRAVLLGALLSAAGLAAGAALAAAAPAPPAPTFEDVLAAPDDLSLNLQFASAEANRGQLLSAAAALERILLARPNWDAVRLLYAVVLYRLDDVQAAELQIKQLNPATLTPLQKAEADKYRRLAERRRAKGQVGGHVTVGMAYDSDALGALTSQFDLPGLVRSESGTTGVVSGRLEGQARLGFDRNVSVYGALSGYGKPSIGGADADFASAEAEAGIRAEALGGSWRVGALIRHYRLFNDPYLTETGGRAVVNFKPTTSTTVQVTGEAVHQEFKEPGVDALLPGLDGSHDGTRYDASIGVTQRLNHRSTLGASVGYESKVASYRPFAYETPRVQVRYIAQLGRGAYIDLFGGAQFMQYRARDTLFLGGARREDLRTNARLAIGAPISAFYPAGATGDFREGLTLEGAVTYANRNSNAPIADYESVGGQLLLIWRFGGDQG